MKKSILAVPFLLASLSVGSAQIPVPSVPLIPQGRLTLQTGVPVQLADEAAVGTIYYASYQGIYVPVFNGSATVSVPIASLQISLILDATDHTSGSAYDIFGVISSGALALCTGPAWSSSSSRGTGAGTTQIHNTITGYWTNAVSLTHCYNNSVDLGPIAADQGTYLGSFYATANGQTTQQFSAAAAAGGSNAFLGLFNAYNRVLVTSRSADSTTSWSYSSQTWHEQDASASNRITWIDGLGVQSVVASSFDLTTGSNTGDAGALFNATTGAPTVSGQAAGTGGPTSQVNSFAGALGLNYAQAMEVSVSGSSVTWYGAGTNPTRQNNALVITLED